MAANVESMFYVRQVPWHGLGIRVQDAPCSKDALTMAGLDWEVQQRQIQTEYGLEQVYNVIDSRYRSQKPLIVTTNLTLGQIQQPEDMPHARIYDRLLEM